MKNEMLFTEKQRFNQWWIWLVLFLLCVFALSNCKAQIKMPSNLDEAVLYFQQRWTQSELDTFKSRPEEDAVTDLHFGTGLWIRNKWIYGNRNPALKKYFKTLGIYAPDDISSIILTSLHRALNKKDIALEAQVKSYKEYWQPVIDCNEKSKALAVSNYNKFKEGDNITIYMPVDTANAIRNAVMYECPTTEWTFDNGKDLIVKGTVLKKYFINDKANLFFAIKISFMNRTDTEILMTEVTVGDTKDFLLTGLRIE